ncbi:hypothetical protein, partial [Enterobacter kobei]|uniref:hypothetical protein n=1 Tax=Enterobacter kobei TaxID=208224 RepID=UPI001EDBFCA0
MNIAAAMAVLATQFHDEASVTTIDNLRIQWRFTILNPDQRGRASLREGANKRGNSSRLTQSFHFFMF